MISGPYRRRVPHRHVHFAHWFLIVSALVLGASLLWPRAGNGEYGTVTVKPPAKPKSSPTREASRSVDQQITDIAALESYRAPKFLVRLAMCESSLNPMAKNKHSSARGLYQIIGKVSDQCAYSVECSTKFTIYHLTHGHTSWWVCADIIS